MNFKRALIILLVICIAGCCPFSKRCEKKADKCTVNARVNHIVFGWLKEPGNMEHREKIIKTCQSLKEIPGIIDLSVGQPIPSDRKIVDDSFDVGMCMVFKNVEDMKKYIDHPEHVKASKEVLMPLMKKVVVYDIIE